MQMTHFAYFTNQTNFTPKLTFLHQR